MKKRLFLSAGCIIMACTLGGCALVKEAAFEKIRSVAESKRPVELEEPYEQELSGALEYELYDEAYETGALGLVSQQLCMESPKGTLYEVEAGSAFPDWNTEEYSYNEENSWCSSTVSPFSTFAADVDTASYANLRRMLLQGQQIVPDAVRIEEMINYFGYSYPAPEGNDPFSVTMEIAPCPWNEDTQLMMIGMKAKEIEKKERPASNLVFLIDVSGSMSDSDKLPLVQRAFRLLIDQLDEQDRISVVTYASGDRVALDGAYGSEKALLCDTIEDLSPGGGTNGSAGLVRAYELAEKYFIEGGNNRVLLATDGDLNIGITDEGSLTRLIEEKAKSGVFLSVLGFGWGNISDTNMEALADHGNGNYSYIDSIIEARKVLLGEAGSNMFTVAKDVKLQVEFNPQKVKGYRLIGYENRMMADENFADDTKDGGEIGSGHSVTAIYEIASADSSFEIPTVERKYGQTAAENTESTDAYADEWATVHIRYKEPDGETSTQLDFIADDSCVKDEMSDDLSWAAGVAQAGMLLKNSEYAGTTDLQDVRERLKPLAGDDELREEFLYMMNRMEA